MSYYSFLLKLGGSVAAAVQGILLEQSGFNPTLAMQGENALNMIKIMFTILPGVCLFGAGVVMAVTPLKDKRMSALRAALEKKRLGESYSVEGFKELLDNQQ